MQRASLDRYGFAAALLRKTVGDAREAPLQLRFDAACSLPQSSPVSRERQCK